LKIISCFSAELRCFPNFDEGGQGETCFHFVLSFPPLGWC
jgi:hypothetical protein